MNNNIKEQLVSFEEAKLLKEKEFQVFCSHYFDSKGNLVEPFLENGSSTDIEFRVDFSDFLENYNYSKHQNTFSAPTQQLAIDWIRIDFGIHIYCYNNGTSWIGSCQSISGAIKKFITNNKTPEEAKSAAIKYTLLNLIK